MNLKLNHKFLSKRYTRLTIKLLLDAGAFASAVFAAFALRFPETQVFDEVGRVVWVFPVAISVRIGCLALFGLYGAMWRYSDLYTMERLAKGITVGTVIFVLLSFFSQLTVLPRSVMMAEWLLAFFIAGGNRILARKVYSSLGDKPKHKELKRVLIYGAGRAGELLLRNIEMTHHAGIRVVGFIDDDPLKRGMLIHDKHVLGDHKIIGEIVRNNKVNEIYFSIPSLSGADLRGLLHSIYEQVGDRIQIKTIPGLTDLINNRVTINELREFDIADLLRRKPVHLERAPVKKLLTERTVLVVGGGGSIGSELSRQIATFGPARLVIMDSSELNVYQIEDQLTRQYPYLNAICLVADACNRHMVERIYRRYRPEIVFHAAAYKHVPLMELNPWAAVENNILSTLNLTDMCAEYEVDKFLLISTDKAVQPTSVMGATKRLCEQITFHQTSHNSTWLMSVRFGNVLGSSGSVIPKFKSQIEAGGPVTVTHKDITRYFMLISEAVELVLQACAIGQNGSIYVLDMGQPIKIYDLARMMIELHGFQPEVDIPIVFTGLRPGEKLHEQLYFEGNETATSVPNLMVLTPRFIHQGGWLDEVRELIQRLHTLDAASLKGELKRLVPDYQPYDAETKAVATVL